MAVRISIHFYFLSLQSVPKSALWRIDRWAALANGRQKDIAAIFRFPLESAPSQLETTIRLNNDLVNSPSSCVVQFLELSVPYLLGTVPNEKRTCD